MAETSVTLRPEVHEAVRRLVETSGAFDDVEDYVNCVLAALVGDGSSEEADADEHAALEQRLEQLGYR